MSRPCITLDALAGDIPNARDTAALVDLMWLVMRQIWDHAEERLAPYSLSLKHNWALHALDEPMSMSALADRLGIDASYVTTIADQLEERGLIERQPHPTDRRIKSLALTPEGRRLRERLADELWVEVPVLDALTAAERRERSGSSHGPSRRHRETECAPDRQQPRTTSKIGSGKLPSRSPTSDIVPPRRSRDTRQDRNPVWELITDATAHRL